MPESELESSASSNTEMFGNIPDRLDEQAKNIAELQDQLKISRTEYERFKSTLDKRESWMLWFVGAIAIVLGVTFITVVCDYTYNKWQADERIYDLINSQNQNMHFKRMQIDF